VSYKINKRVIYKFLESIRDNDYLTENFDDKEIENEMLFAFCYNGLIWLSSDGRILITPEGEKVLFEWKLSVDSEKR